MKFLMISLLMASIIFFLGNLTNKKNFLKKEKNSPFECGFDPFSLSRTPFSLRFFMIAIIFLIFDIEIVILLPFPITQNLDSISSLMMMFTIISLILIGLVYEWKNGMIEWVS
ncbi:NADH dehydrogenase subunit 3 (mitochondrion) [Ornithodoros turicata]|uniref:NADH-ubiquinone oxidoreductase chain 3 n=1 Tax=Ornithodoros turicata TaxID=34597 RepID=A0A3G2JZX4_9ACAR|nr:NADH dehydrogenase subunit 3 [Ornithodoros turicata]AYN50591.1 NADH dehydrogenase subunit 3 [Ornithodoros turicata]UYB78697.1 NADH dehydrogenase subunit 3 [Ornithodoros turicata]UYB78723.1 NADH dehydrogenase subunit 3 [Ornithodoros turicata]